MSHDPLADDLARRAKTALKLLFLVIVYSVISYYMLGCFVGMNARYGKQFARIDDDHWPITECIYQAAITLTTVGYGDMLGTDTIEVWQDRNGHYRWESTTDPHTSHPDYDREGEELLKDYSVYGRILSSTQAVMGMAFFLYVVAQLTSFFVEGGIEELTRARRMRKLMGKVKDHIIVVGAGDSARHAVGRIRVDGVACAVLDPDKSALDAMQQAYPQIPCLPLDATEEEALHAAGIERARGLLSTLPDDSMNLVAVVTAQQIRQDVRIVSRAEKRTSAARLQRAGASACVLAVNLIGMRVASELVRPSVVDFLDVLLGRSADSDIVLEGFRVGAHLAGYTIAALGIRERTGLELVALKRAGARVFVYNPSRGETLGEGDTLAVIGAAERVEKLRQLLATSPGSDDDQDEDEELLEDLVAADAIADVTLAVDDVEHDRTVAERERRDHYIVCGAGRIGQSVIRELYATKRAFVIVDWRREAIERLQVEFPGVDVIEGDADDPDVLRDAGVEFAHGLAATLASDRTNLVIAVTALQARPDMRVITLGRDDDEIARLRKAGSRVISAGRIAGNRLAAEMLRPSVTTFLTEMLSAPGAARFEGVVVGEGSEMAGRKIGDTGVYGRTGLRLLALRRPGQHAFVSNPDQTEVLEVGTLLVVAGTHDRVQRLAELAGDWE